MTNLQLAIQQNPEQCLTAILVGGVLLLILVVFLWVHLLSFKKRFKGLMRNAQGENIEQLLKEHLLAVKAHQELAEQNRARMSVLEEHLRQCVQYVGIKRFNAFEEQGSRLSYSIAFLDDYLDGIILTSIYGRHESTTYAKQIRHGQAEQHLSVEEMDALLMAKEPRKKREQQ